MNKRILQILAWMLLSFGSLISIYIVISACIDGIEVYNSNKIDFQLTGQFGDFIGGVVGTIISGAGFIFLYLTFKEQREAANDQKKLYQHERFESKFFELIKLHRDNVSEMKYRKTENEGIEINEGRKVFKLIFSEFLECLKEVRNYSATKDPNDYIKPKYKSVLSKIINPINNKIDLYQMATIDIAFCIVFYGLDKEGMVIVKRFFSEKYAAPYYQKLIMYLQMKPTKENHEEFSRWELLKLMSHERRLQISDEIYENRSSDLTKVCSSEALYHSAALKCKKYYGGHQHRLGHYFRHLFQCYKFLNAQKNLSSEEKYFYGKTLRAQLSIYEQALLFINSISSIGFKWEFIPDYTDDRNLSAKENEAAKNDQKLITKYNLIKNLPGTKYLDIRYKDYYPKVQFESEDFFMPKI